MPSAALAAARDSPSPYHHRGRLRSPLANGGAEANFELRHWRTPLKRAPSCPPPGIEIPVNGDDGGYTSLRDILSSPRYTAAGGSPAAFVIGGAGSCGDIHMIRHPLVKHAAYAYLQMTPSAREDPARRSRPWRGPLCRLLLDCLGFIGALFRP